MRLLTASEKTGFIIRHPLTNMGLPLTLPEQGMLVPDSDLGCVLIFKKADGTYLYIYTDGLYPTCSWDDGPSPAVAFVQTLGEQLTTRSESFLGQVSEIMTAFAIILVVWLVVTGRLQKFLKELT